MAHSEELGKPLQNALDSARGSVTIRSSCLKRALLPPGVAHVPQSPDPPPRSIQSKLRCEQLEDRAVPADLSGNLYFDTNLDGIQNTHLSTGKMRWLETSLSGRMQLV